MGCLNSISLWSLWCSDLFLECCYVVPGSSGLFLRCCNVVPGSSGLLQSFQIAKVF